MSDLRKALEQAMSSSGKDLDEDESEDNTSVIDPPEDVIDDANEPADSDSGDGDTEPKTAEFDAEDKTGEAPKGKQADTSSKVEKPPVGWTPESREHWAKLPQNVRQQISKREVEVNKLLQDTADARRLHQEFGRTVEPYRALMASQGVNNPLEAVNGLLETAAALSMGNDNQKAQRLAGLIKHYGIDIETLDSILAGEEPQQRQGNPNADIENLINQRLAPYEQDRQRQQQEQQYQVRQRAAISVNQVAQKEFFNDVRMDMADIVEMATKRGQSITMEQAYEKAVQLNPEIQRVVRGRQSSQDIHSKHNAASGIRGNRSGVPDGNGNLDLRSQLEANWNIVSSGRT